MSLSKELAARYTVIIDDILSKSDLLTVSTAGVRRGLQERVDHDISKYKQEIKALIVTRFDHFQNGKEAAASSGSATPQADAEVAAKPIAPPAPLTNGNHVAHTSPNTALKTPSPGPKRESEELSDVIDDRPPKKKVKRETVEEDDAAIAARLQAEENSRARPTRNAGSNKKKPIVKRKIIKKDKSSKKVNSDDDSDVASGAETKSPKRNGAFHKPLTLSPPLAALLGETTLSRPQTVKKIWEYVRAHSLQNPDDKRQIVCDDNMRAVFKQDTVHMFTMNKILALNLYDPEE